MSIKDWFKPKTSCYHQCSKCFSTVKDSDCMQNKKTKEVLCKECYKEKIYREVE